MVFILQFIINFWLKSDVLIMFCSAVYVIRCPECGAVEVGPEMSDPSLDSRTVLLSPPQKSRRLPASPGTASGGCHTKRNCK